MKLHLCGAVAATIFLAGCGQMGPLVLPPKEEPAKVKEKTPVSVQPAAEVPTSGVNPAPAEPSKESP